MDLWNYEYIIVYCLIKESSIISIIFTFDKVYHNFLTSSSLTIEIIATISIMLKFEDRWVRKTNLNIVWQSTGGNDGWHTELQC